MEKIPTVFERDWEGDRSRVLDQIVPGCEWVIEGKGVATRKVDGTCVMFDGEAWWARREVKPDQEAPANFRPVSTDHKTLKKIGWQPIDDSPFVKFWNEAMDSSNIMETWTPGTYELLGPKVNKNPEGLEKHELWKHEFLVSHVDQTQITRTFQGMQSFLEDHDWEGIVFVDGRRMAKIKARDFGLRRGHH